MYCNWLLRELYTFHLVLRIEECCSESDISWLSLARGRQWHACMRAWVHGYEVALCNQQYGYGLWWFWHYRTNMSPDPNVTPDWLEVTWLHLFRTAEEHKRVTVRLLKKSWWQRTSMLLIERRLNKSTTKKTDPKSMASSRSNMLCSGIFKKLLAEWDHKKIPMH